MREILYGRRLHAFVLLNAAGSAILVSRHMTSPSKHEVNVRARTTEELERGLLANRKHAIARDPKGRKLWGHILPFRPFFVREMLWMRDELRKRSSGDGER